MWILKLWFGCSFTHEWMSLSAHALPFRLGWSDDLIFNVLLQRFFDTSHWSLHTLEAWAG